MQQRDLILREIEKIGTVVRAIIDKIRGKEGALEEEAVDYVHHSAWIKENLQLDVDFLIQSPMHQIKEYFSKNTGFNSSNIELLGDMLSELSTVSPAEDEIILQRRALDLYAYAIELDKTFSLDRDLKIEGLQQKID